jgi:hypothetical protein
MWAVHDKEQAMREEKPVPKVLPIPRSNAISNVSVSTPDYSGSSGISPAPSAVPSAASIPPVSPMLAPTDSSGDNSMAQLSLVLKAFPQPVVTTASGASQSQNLNPPSILAGRTTRPLQCIWWDSTEHLRRNCAELAAALSAGITCYNEKGRLANGATGVELPLMYGKGEMKAVSGRCEYSQHYS